MNMKRNDSKHVWFLPQNIAKVFVGRKEQEIASDL